MDENEIDQEIKRVLEENKKPFLPKEPVFEFAEGREFMKGYAIGSIVTLICMVFLFFVAGVI